MKFIKTAFLISLFNFFLVTSLVLAVNKFNPPTPDNNAESAPTLAPTETPVSPTSIPTSAPQRVERRHEEDDNDDPFAEIFNNPVPTSKPVAQNTQPINSSNPTSPPQQQQVQQAAPTADNRCLITIDGQRYDVSVYRNQHSGGDVFRCGSDMSSIFHNRHPSSFLSRMSQYKI